MATMFQIKTIEEMLKQGNGQQLYLKKEEDYLMLGIQIYLQKMNKQEGIGEQ